MSTFSPSPEFDAAIEKTSKEKFGCAICEEPIIEATSTNCGHQFCSFCLKKWMMYFNRCPHCKSILSATAPRPMTDTKLRELYKLATPDLHTDRSMCINYRKLQQIKLKLGGVDNDLLSSEIKPRGFALLNPSPAKPTGSEASGAILSQPGNQSGSAMRLVTSTVRSSDHVSNLFGAASSKQISDRIPLADAKVSLSRDSKLMPCTMEESVDKTEGEDFI